MSVELAVGYVSILPSARNFGTKLSSELGPIATSAGTEAGTKAGKSFSSGMGAALKVAGGLFIADKVKDMFLDVVGAGSDLNETINKTKAVFGAGSKEALRFGDASVRGLGQSKRAALEGLSTLGNLFVSLGLGRRKALDMGKGMLSLAADLGSFNNVPTDDALEAIRSGLVGETEPLRKFGVNMNEATLKAKALQLGIADGTSVLTPAQRAQAAYALILEQTTTAQGDWNKTQGEAAGQSKIVAAGFENIKAKLGQALLPVYEAFLAIGRRVLGFLSEHATLVQGLAIAVGIGLVAAFTAWTASLITSASALIVTMAPILAVVAAVGLLVAAVVLVWTHWDQIWTWIKDHPAYAAIIAILAAPIAAFVLIIGALHFLWENWDQIWGWIRQAAADAWGVIGPILGFIRDRILDVWNATSALRDIWGAVWGGLSSAVQAAWDAIRPVIDFIIGAVRTAVEIVGTLVAAVEHFNGISPLSGGGGDTASGLEHLVKPGKRAGGGPVMAGMPYIVGEHRAELFVPDVNGTIEPSVPGRGGLNIETAYFGDRNVIPDLDWWTRTRNAGN